MHTNDNRKLGDAVTWSIRKINHKHKFKEIRKEIKKMIR